MEGDWTFEVLIANFHTPEMSEAMFKKLKTGEITMYIINLKTLAKNDLWDGCLK